MSESGSPQAEEFGAMVTMTVLRQVARAIERLFEPYCEVLIHDFSDLEHSIVHLEGNLSNRRVGGAATDLLLARVRAGQTEDDLHNYRTELPDGRLMKSSTTFLRDTNGKAYGAFCINFDMTPFLSLQKVVSTFTRIEVKDDIAETLSDDIHQTIGGIISSTIAEIGANGPVLSREDKIQLIAKLDEKGVFQVKRAAHVLADQFGFSRATIYNYLRTARNNKLQAFDDNEKANS